MSQLNNYTLSPIEDQRVSEAAGVNSAAGSFGLSFGLAMAGGIMLAFLAFDFTNLVDDSAVIPPAQQQQIVEHAGARRRGHEQLPARAAARRRASGRPGRGAPDQHEARDRSLQVALLVPLLASLLGLLNSFRMMRLPDPIAAGSGEGMALG